MIYQETHWSCITKKTYTWQVEETSCGTWGMLNVCPSQWKQPEIFSWQKWINLCEDLSGWNSMSIVHVQVAECWLWGSLLQVKSRIHKHWTGSWVHKEKLNAKENMLLERTSVSSDITTVQLRRLCYEEHHILRYITKESKIEFMYYNVNQKNNILQSNP